MVEVYYGHYVPMDRGEALLRGARRSGFKTWPSGVRERVYRMPRMAAQSKKDDGHRGLDGKVHLSQVERKSIERLTGIKVYDAQDARRAIKAKGMRFLEKGEELDETLKRQEAGEKVPFPGWDRLGVMPAPKSFDWEESLARNRQKYGEN